MQLSARILHSLKDAFCTVYPVNIGEPSFHSEHIIIIIIA